MSFIDKVKGTLHETATIARDGIEEIHVNRELNQAYGDLGRRAVELMDAGKLTSAELDFDVEKIRALRAESASAAPVAS